MLEHTAHHVVGGGQRRVSKHALGLVPEVIALERDVVAVVVDPDHTAVDVVSEPCRFAGGQCAGQMTPPSIELVGDPSSVLYFTYDAAPAIALRLGNHSAGDLVDRCLEQPPTRVALEHHGAVRGVLRDHLAERVVG